MIPKKFYFKKELIEFRDWGAIYVNANQLAKSYNKDVYDWLEEDYTINYIEALEDRETDFTSFITKEYDWKTEDPIIWLHSKAAIEYVRWLSPKDSNWVNFLLDGKIKSEEEQELRKNNIIYFLLQKINDMESMGSMGRRGSKIESEHDLHRCELKQPPGFDSVFTYAKDNNLDVTFNELLYTYDEKAFHICKSLGFHCYYVEFKSTWAKLFPIEVLRETFLDIKSNNNKSWVEDTDLF